MVICTCVWIIRLISWMKPFNMSISVWFLSESLFAMKAYFAVFLLCFASLFYVSSDVTFELWRDQTVWTTILVQVFVKYWNLNRISPLSWSMTNLFSWRSGLLLVENVFPHSALRHFERRLLLSSPLSDIFCCFVHYLSELKTQIIMFTFQHSILWHHNAMASQHCNGFILFQKHSA